jgi:polyisoprenyl-phosphate glycosyltransferase
MEKLDIMASGQSNLIILIPVYNDWACLAILLCEIDKIAEMRKLNPHLVIVDDGSSQSSEAIRKDVQKFGHIKQIDVIHLARNLGHQKAIALGLAYINNNTKPDQVIVMDGDGEDRPEDISRLLDQYLKFPDAIIFAQRARRSEGIIFRFFYALYKLVFRTLTGADISFGNFSLIPEQLLHRIVYLPEIWNHFAAGIVRSKVPLKVVPTSRGVRYIGRSSMNLVSLIIHGLSAISIFNEILTVRLILFSSAVILSGILGFVSLIYVKYFTTLAIPGWATTVAIGLVVIMFQAVVLLALLSFLILNYRSTKQFIPVKDYEDYLFSVERFL